MDIFNIDSIPFNELGLGIYGLKILKAIDYQLTMNPENPLDIDLISKTSSVDPKKVKILLYFLATFNSIGKTFRARHLNCDNIISKEYKSVGQVKSDLYNFYGTVCEKCHHSVINNSSVYIEMRFWRKETLSCKF